MEGTWYVLPTAFDEGGELDLDAQRTLVERVIGWRADGLVTMGVTSEATALSESERDHVVRAVLDATRGRAPVVVGCSSASVEVVVERTTRAARLGASASLVSAPPAVRDVEALPDFFSSVADLGGLRVVVQDEPAATGTTIPAEVLVRCVEAARAEAVKLEDPPTPPKIAAIVEALPDMRVFGGLGGLYALEELRRGASGTMTGFAFPEILAAVRSHLTSGAGGAGARTFDRYLPLIAFEAQQKIGLGIRKELLRRRGALRSATTRIGMPPDPDTVAALEDVLYRVGITPSPDPLEVA